MRKDHIASLSNTYIQSFGHCLKRLQDRIESLNAFATRQVHVERHTRQIVDKTLFVHDFHHIIDQIGVSGLRLISQTLLLLLLGLILNWRTRFDHRIYDGSERLNLNVFVV
jgi:hypothetical protein